MYCLFKEIIIYIFVLFSGQLPSFEYRQRVYEFISNRLQ